MSSENENPITPSDAEGTATRMSITLRPLLEKASAHPPDPPPCQACPTTGPPQRFAPALDCLSMLPPTAMVRFSP